MKIIIVVEISLKNFWENKFLNFLNIYCLFIFNLYIFELILILILININNILLIFKL